MALPYEQLVIGGGGVKGFAMLGALHALQDAGVLDLADIRIFAGTSIGAAICLLLACGMRPLDIFFRIDNGTIKINVDTPLSFAALIGIGERYGLMDVREVIGSELRKLVCEYLKVDEPPTLLELYKQTGKQLRIATMNLTREEEQMLSMETVPEMSCVDAVCASANVPFVFSRLEINSELYIDGMLVNNFPIAYVDEMIKTIAISVPSDRTRRRSAIKTHSTRDPHETLFWYISRVLNTPNHDATRRSLASVSPSTLLVRVDWDAAIVGSASLVRKPSRTDMHDMWAMGEASAVQTMRAQNVVPCKGSSAESKPPSSSSHLELSPESADATGSSSQ